MLRRLGQRQHRRHAGVGALEQRAPVGPRLRLHHGGEALLRWFHPERGQIPTADFIAVAEETGLIGDIGKWALQRVCQDLGQWRKEGLTLPQVAVNVSGRDFMHPEALLRLLEIDAASMPPQRDKAGWGRWKEVLTARFRTRTRDEWCHVLEGTDACFAPVLSMAEAHAHPHNQARGAFIDQSQSLNLFLESPTIGKLSSMYMYAWKKGLKTTYYLRSRPASKISKTTVPLSKTTGAAAVTCSLENPGSCEACQ